MAGPVVRVEGAAELSRSFRAAGGTVRELSGAYREVARSLVPPAQLPDGIHPDDAGHALLAGALGPLLSAQLAGGSR